MRKRLNREFKKKAVEFSYSPANAREIAEELEIEGKVIQ
jgi:transposase-like protein